MRQLGIPSQNRPPLWQLLWRPMLLAALGIHGVLLFYPMSAHKQKAATEDDKSVKLTRLSAMKLAQNAAGQIRPKAPQVVARNPEIVIKASPAPLPGPAVSPSPGSKGKTSQAAAKPSAKGETSAAATVLSPEEQGFVSRLQGLEGREVSDPVSSALFNNPEAFYLDPAKDLGKPGVVGIEYVSFQKPEDVHQQLLKLYSDFSVTPRPDYADSPVYELRKGPVVLYLSLVRAKLAAGTLIVLWKRSPT